MEKHLIWERKREEEGGREGDGKQHSQRLKQNSKHHLQLPTEKRLLIWKRKRRGMLLQSNSLDVLYEAILQIF